MWVASPITDPPTGRLVASAHSIQAEAQAPVSLACLQALPARYHQASLLPRLAIRLRLQDLPALASPLLHQGTLRLLRRPTTLRRPHAMDRLHRLRTRPHLQLVTLQRRLSTRRHHPTTVQRLPRSWVVPLRPRTARRRHNTALLRHSTVLPARNTRQAAIVALLHPPHHLSTARRHLDTRPLAQQVPSLQPLQDTARLLRVRRTLPHPQSNRRLVDAGLLISSLFYIKICSLLWMIWTNSLQKLSKPRGCVLALLVKGSI
jgi:hypothetical protein